MLNQKQIEEIKEHLEKAQNPVFYYDNDADGLCSFLLLRRYLGRGKGVVVRSFPDLNAQYAKKAEELKADYVFILDKPVISNDFFQEIEKMQIPIVWIDHHDIEEEKERGKFTNLFRYNWARNKGKDKSDEPVTYWIYKIVGKKEELWIAVMGCIADHYLPDFVDNFEKEYSDLWGKVKEPFEAYYETEIGKIAQALGFGLKDSTTHIVQLQNFLIGCKNPREVLAEVDKNAAFRQKYKDIMRRYQSLLKRALENVQDKIIFFEYSGDLSMSSEIANNLCYLYPNKYVIVVYRKGIVSNISMRGKNVKKILEISISSLEEAFGGGHEDAVGARIKSRDIGKFREKVESYIEKS